MDYVCVMRNCDTRKEEERKKGIFIFNVSKNIRDIENEIGIVICHQVCMSKTIQEIVNKVWDVWIYFYEKAKNIFQEFDISGRVRVLEAFGLRNLWDCEIEEDEYFMEEEHKA